MLEYNDTICQVDYFMRHLSDDQERLFRKNGEGTRITPKKGGRQRYDIFSWELKNWLFVDMTHSQSALNSQDKIGNFFRDISSDHDDNDNQDDNSPDQVPSVDGIAVDKARGKKRTSPDVQAPSNRQKEANKKQRTVSGSSPSNEENYFSEISRRISNGLADVVEFSRASLTKVQTSIS